MYALEGLKVIDVAINYAGPTSSMYLADQGAEVIKIERRVTGDTSRRHGNTPFLKGNSRNFVAINRGKRSITLDITKPDGQVIVRDLAARADVFIENFRPGVMERLGIGYDALSAINPRLIYGSLTAYGPKGPYADKAGFDRLVAGMSGALWRRDAEGRRLGAGTFLADWSAPMLMAFGIMLALAVREKTGLGQRVETSLLQAAIAMQLGELTIIEDDPTPPTEEEPPAYGGYVCADGVTISMTALFPPQWARLCQVMDLPHLADDPRFTDPAKRDELRNEAAPIFHALFATRPAHEWLDILEAADVPCAPIVERPRVAYHEQVVANDMMVAVNHPVIGLTRIVGVPVKLSRTPSAPLRPAPTLGEHTDDILGELGYSSERIAELRAAEVI